MSHSLSPEKSRIITYFCQNRYFVWNVRDKCPVAGTGNNGWSKILYDDIQQYWDINSSSWGMRTGRQPNGKYIIGLDFDTWFKVGAEYSTCNNTVRLLAEFIKLLGVQQDGFYISGTENNRGCLVNIEICPEIINLLDEIGKGRFQAENFHLEILNGHNFVIPPTATICKVSKIMRERTFINGTYIYELTPEKPIYKFIVDYIKKCNLKTELSKSTLKLKRDKEIYTDITSKLDTGEKVVSGFNKKLINFLNCIKNERGSTYDNWFKLGIACQKNCNTEEDKNVAYQTFKLWSSNLNGYDDCSFDRHWNSWFNYTYEGLNFNYIMKIAKHDNPEKWFSAWIGYKLECETQEYSTMIDKFECNVRCILQPSVWITKMFTVDNIEKWELVINYADIIHKYHMDFPIDFVQEYKVSTKKKKYYHMYEFLPTFNPPEYKDKNVYQSFRGWDILNKRVTLNEAHTTKIINDFENHKFTIQQEGKGIIFFKHIEKLIGNEKAVWFMLQWLANLITEPDKRACCVPIIKGREGSGKTSIYELISALLDGDSYFGDNAYCLMIDNPADILEKFNKILWEKIVVNLNEPNFGNLDRFKDKNKRYITDKSIVIEGKGENAITVKNTLWQIITTNNDNILSISATERRYFIIACKDDLISNKDHFTQFYHKLTDKEALMDFYLFLKQIRNPSFGPLQYVDYINSNRTLYHQQMVQTSISPFWSLMGQYITDCESEQIPDIMKKPVDIHKDLNQYCRLRGLSNPEDTNSIKIKLLDIDPRCFKRPRVYVEGREVRDEKYILAIDKVRQYMDAKHLTDPTISLD
jgi:hypothetical protein